MMKALTKAMREEREALAAELRERFSTLEMYAQCFNTTMQDAWGPVKTAMEQYNAVVEKVNDWKSAIAAEIQTYIDERSEQWQDSARGQVYQDWLNAYGYDDLDPVTLDLPASLDLSDGDQTDLLEALP
jgi:hypothetical protein